MRAHITRGGGARARQLTGGQRRRCRHVAIRNVAVPAVLLLLAVVVSTTASLAQSRDGSASGSREVFLGTFSAHDRSAPRADDRGKSAARLLSDAMSALDNGEVMLGRRRLEVLVERYPETLAATTAREELGRLYSDRRGAPGESAAALRQDLWSPAGQTTGSTGPGRSAEPEPHEPRTTDPSAGGRVPSSRDQRVVIRDERRIQALLAEFQTTAGDRVFFGETDTDLGSRARTVLAAQVRWLRDHPDLTIAIEAHADDNGSASFNAELAKRRGMMVRDRLIDEGIAPERISMQAYGREQPVATCRAPECAAQNRRVVTVIRPRLHSDAGDDTFASPRSRLATTPVSDRRQIRD